MRRQVIYNPQRDYYTVLGIDAHSSPDQLRHAYRQAVRDAHPDRNPDRVEWATERLMLLNEAYDVLGNPDLRRRYDRARWPYVPFAAPDRAAASDDPWFDIPYHASRWNVPPTGPWWQQASRDPSASASMRAPQPEWLLFARWLKDHRLGLLEPAWLAVVGLWRSPYRRALVVLALALWINISVLSYAVLSPGRAARAWSDLRAWVDGGEPAALPASPLPHATPTRLIVLCADPAIQITQPSTSEVIGDQLVVAGTVQPPDLGAYTVLMGYLGPVLSRMAQPERWITLRQKSDQGSARLPLIDAPLVDGPVDMTAQPAGYWVLRLAVTTQEDVPLDPCDIVFQHQ